MRCEKHPEYTGLKDPRGSCRDCWKIRSTRLQKEIKGLRAELREVGYAINAFRSILNGSVYLPRTRP